VTINIQPSPQDAINVEAIARAAAVQASKSRYRKTDYLMVAGIIKDAGMLNVPCDGQRNDYTTGVRHVAPPSSAS
jgi:hypothetical protein